MIVTAITLFLVAALFGIYMALRIFGGGIPPWAAVILHGLFAASGLLVLFYALFTGTQSTAVVIAAVLLVVAALGGFFMFSYQLRKLPPPKAVVVIHALAAVLGVVALLGNVLGMV
jgi:hypothetical protein